MLFHSSFPFHVLILSPKCSAWQGDPCPSSTQSKKMAPWQQPPGLFLSGATAAFCWCGCALASSVGRDHLSLLIDLMGQSCCPGIFHGQRAPKSDRLGPGTFCCSAAMLAPGQMSPQTTKYKETKNNCMPVHLGQILDKKIQRDQKAEFSLLKSWEKKQDTTCPLHTIPPKRWANHLSHPSGLIPRHPYAHPV